MIFSLKYQFVDKLNLFYCFKYVKMTTTATSAKKANVYNDANDGLYSAYPKLLPVDEVYSDITWPEWNDAEINSENWGETKGTATRTKPASSVVSFEDQEPLELPILIREHVHSWKRPHEIFISSNLTVYDPSNEEFRLSLQNPLADCGLFEYFNEIFPVLQYYAFKYEFPVESESPTFVSTTVGQPWRPWHHIYANCKAGKGQIHAPSYSSYGKYIIRLYYMGSWRKFVVDDKIPCDKYGKCILPVTQVSGELWPILLTKAILKISSLTVAIGLCQIELPFLSLFTGWIRFKITASNKSREQIWRRIVIFTPRYETLQEEETIKTAPSSLKDVMSKRGSSKKKLSKSSDKKADLSSEMFSLCLANLKGIPEEEKNKHIIAVTTHRNLPLVKAEKRERTKMWKRIRWIYWASKKGLWTDELKMPPYRRLQYITLAKELKRLLAPDPNQVAIMFNIPSDDELALNDQLSSEDGKSEHWSDFFKLHEYLLSLDVLIKPSFLPYKFVMTCLSNESEEMSSRGAKLPERPPANLYFQAATLRPTCNYPPLMLCESKSEIFLCISLSVSPVAPKSDIGYLDANQPELLRITHSSLVVERLDWRTIEQGEIIGLVQTVGNSTIILNLKAGRHILRFWLHSDCPYIVEIYSNVEICVHQGPKIRFLMNNETERILDYITNVSNAFIALTQKLGKSDLPIFLKSFYEVIKPGNIYISGYSSKIDEFIQTFLNCILLELKELIPTNNELRIMMGALQSLFINLNIRCDFLQEELPESSIQEGKKVAKKPVPVVKEKTLYEILSYPWTASDIVNITRIQKIFRGYRVRLLWKRQTPSRKEFKPYNDQLKRICDVIFAPGKREMEVGKIIRKVVQMRPDLMKTFKFYQDLPNVIQLDEYTGKIPNVEPFAWVPMVRFIIACHCDEPVPCSFHFSCNLEQFIVQGVDNDTNEELFQLTNSISPHYYRSNVKGYTIFVYGWNEANAKTVNWRLEMVRLKYFQVIHLCNTLQDLNCHPYAIPSLAVLEVRNIYVPNHKSRICRCLIKIQKRTLLTLRLSASYREAQFIVIISLDKKYKMPDSEASEDNDLVITKVQSTNGVVMLPAIILEYAEPNPWWGESNTDDEATLYIVEAFVINNSWPLTKQEWGIVELTRAHSEFWKDSGTNLHSKKGTIDYKKKLTRACKRTQSEFRAIENPFWSLQVVNDSTEDSGDQIIVEENRSNAESIRLMKMSWEEKNPGRSKKGRELRLKFLRMIHDEENKPRGRSSQGFMHTIESEMKSTEGNVDFDSLLKKLTTLCQVENDVNSERFFKSPRVLPKMPTAKLLSKYRNQGANNVLEGESEVATSLNRNMIDEIEEDRKDFLRQCLHYRKVLWNHLAEEQKLSIRLMKEAYEGRLKAVERLER